MRILIVDDHPENVYLLRALLRGHGHEVEEAADGAAALVAARRNPPDLIVSDLLMPVLDGYALLRHWRGDGRFRYALVFKNQGADAGASIAHLHSQLIHRRLAPLPSLNRARDPHPRAVAALMTWT